MSTREHLISGENFSFKKKFEREIINISDIDINEKYTKGEIRIVTEQARYPLDTIENMLKSNKYNLNPEYQRRKRWNKIRKSRLIESFIMNVPIPPIFLYEVDYSFYEVMDGLQRLTAIFEFYTNQFELEGLEYWQELNGRKYNQLPDQVRKGIDRRYLSSIVLLQETAKNKEEADYLKQIVFERLNSGGEKLTPQETRNALHGGVFNSVCINLAKNENFKRMWGFPLELEIEEGILDREDTNVIKRYREMEDVELVLRFFAFRHIEDYKGTTIEKFLDEYLRQANSYDSETIKHLEILFNETIDLVYKIFAEKAFVLPPKSPDRTPKRTIYDPIMQAFSKYLSYKEVLINAKDDIKRELYSNEDDLYLPKEKNNYLFDGRYNNWNNVLDRVNYFEKFIKRYI